MMTRLFSKPIEYVDKINPYSISSVRQRLIIKEKIMIQEKKCKGMNKAYGAESCGNLTNVAYLKAGLCVNCYADFIMNDERGKVIFQKTLSKATKSVNKVSDKRKEQNKEYSKLRKEFLSQSENRICPITGTEATDVHHKKGRVGSLFLDTTYWMALSREGHKFVEENPEWAKEKGYSLNRLSND